MSEEWTHETLADVCSTITDGAHFSPKEDLAGLPMASVKDLTRYGIDLSNVKRISRVDFESLKRQGCMPLKGDVLIAKDGNSALDTVCVHNLDEEVTLLSSVAILRPNQKVISGFLRYYLDAPQIRAMLKEGFRSGSAIPRVVLKDFRRAPISYPPLPEQRAIAGILGALDDKIELNRRTNETLEGIARAIFKSWFVDFDPVWEKMARKGKGTQRKGAETQGRRGEGWPDYVLELFPDEFEESELGETPRGWKVQPIGDLAQVLGGGTPSTKEPDYWEGGIHPFCTPKDMAPLTSPVLLSTERFLTDKGLTKVSSGQLPRGTVLLSSRAPIGYLAIAETAVSVNQGIIAMVCNGELPNLYTLYWTEANMERILANANGSTFLEISKQNFRPIQALVPPRLILNEFEHIVKTLHQRIVSALRENQQLTMLRDTLLPKLISGKLRVPDAERIVGRCV